MQVNVSDVERDAEPSLRPGLCVMNKIESESFPSLFEDSSTPRSVAFSRLLSSDVSNDKSLESGPPAFNFSASDTSAFDKNVSPENNPGMPNPFITRSSLHVTPTNSVSQGTWRREQSGDEAPRMTYQDLYGGGNDLSHVACVGCPKCGRPCDSGLTLGSCGHEICLSCAISSAYDSATSTRHSGLNCPVCGKLSKLDDNTLLLLSQGGDNRVKQFRRGRPIAGTVVGKAMKWGGSLGSPSNAPHFNDSTSTIGEGSLSYAVYSDYRCEIHQEEPVKYWCVTCRSRLLCSKCCIGRGGNRNHCDHKILLLEEAFKLVENKIETEILPGLDRELIEGDLLAKQASSIIEEGNSQLKQIFCEYQQTFVPERLEATRSNTKKCLAAVRETIIEIQNEILKPMINQNTTPMPLYIKYSSAYSICKWYAETPTNESLRLTAQSQRGQLAIVDLALRFITEKCYLRKYLASNITTARRFDEQSYGALRPQHSPLLDTAPINLFKISRK